ncbi:hypothetical protein ARMGADRAFT_1040815 [Armillaria gallica]|uniref:Uncharacterized protein n=1 Tax=Armillaria gallica TaxID=47427 RepID=A0A2H3CRS0_ARMGA|nr:hypothetical protein ARMGADRAFT_1040815 [Armillaria gallica]
MPQPKNIWMKLASLVVASVNPGILSYIVAFVVVIGVSLSTILSPLKPGSMVKTLHKTVEKTYTDYDEHKDKLNELAGFDDKVNRLRIEVFKLKERCLQAPNDMSLTDLRSWRRYMRETKDIWVKARQSQRKIVELRKALKLSIVRARRDELEAAFAQNTSVTEPTFIFSSPIIGVVLEPNVLGVPIPLLPPPKQVIKARSQKLAAVHEPMVVMILLNFDVGKGDLRLLALLLGQSSSRYFTRGVHAGGSEWGLTGWGQTGSDKSCNVTWQEELGGTCHVQGGYINSEREGDLCSDGTK